MSVKPRNEPEKCAGCHFLEWAPKTDIWGCYHPDVTTHGIENPRIGLSARVCMDYKCKGEWFQPRTNGETPP